MLTLPSDYWKKFHVEPDERNPWQWAGDTIRLKNSPFGARFLPDLTPWIKEPLEEIAKNENVEITCMCCVQGCKTVMMQVAAAWAIAFEPGPMMFNCQTDDDSDDFAKERWATTLLSIPGIEARLPHDKARRSFSKLSLTDMFMLIQGANRQNLQSKSIRWLFNDEVFLWKKGLLDEARKRTTQYWNRRRVNGSTAGEKGCDMDAAFESGDKREWHLACPTCGALNLPKRERIKWPKDGAVKRENGDWNYREVKALTYFECEHCSAQIKHTEEAHKQMNAGAKYIATNSNPTPGWLSFRWNALCLSPSVCSWGDLAVEWLKSEIEFKKGNEAPRREFIQKRLAESYDGSSFEHEPLPTIKIEGAWADEAYRFMTVDVQQTCFWYVIRAWAKNGASRLLSAGRLDRWEDVEKKQNEFGVSPKCVFVDAAYQQEMVVAECSKRNQPIKVGEVVKEWVGWRALDGENRETKRFTFKAKGKDPVLYPYSWPPTYLRASDGRSCKFNLWSNKTIKDILVRLRDGKGASWLAYEGAPLDWHKHMYSERRRVVYDNFGRESVVWERMGRQENHLWDCEAMNIVPAHMAGVIGGKHLEDESD